MAGSPIVVVVAGPNGAGKSTGAEEILSGSFGLREFVNADTIARGLSGFDPDSSALAAGRIMLARLHDLAGQRASFAFETTLASRSFAPWLAELRGTGYRFGLLFHWMPSPDACVARVTHRVARGGHHVPADVIARRYARGLANLKTLYLPIADEWTVVDNTHWPPRTVALGGAERTRVVTAPLTWSKISS
ncbi:MAG: AAA family ATPase [Planctomycetota bacterium]